MIAARGIPTLDRRQPVREGHSPDLADQRRELRRQVQPLPQRRVAGPQTVQPSLVFAVEILRPADEVERQLRGDGGGGRAGGLSGPVRRPGRPVLPGGAPRNGAPRRRTPGSPAPPDPDATPPRCGRRRPIQSIDEGGEGVQLRRGTPARSSSRGSARLQASRRTAFTPRPTSPAIAGWRGLGSRSSRTRRCSSARRRPLLSAELLARRERLRRPSPPPAPRARRRIGRRGGLRRIGRRPRRRVAQRPMDGRGHPPQQPLDRLAQVSQQVEAVGHLAGLRRRLGRRLRERRPAVPRDELDARVLAQPRLQRLAVPPRQQVQDPAAFEVDYDRAVALALANRPVVDADVARRWRLGSPGQALTRRNRVSGLVGISSKPASRLPASPPKAKPMSRWASVRRVVERA